MRRHHNGSYTQYISHLKIAVGICFGFSLGWLGATSSRLTIEVGNNTPESFMPWRETNHEYIPSISEEFIMNNLENLGYDSEDDPNGCNIWLDQNATNAKIYERLISYGNELDRYNQAIQQFQPVNMNIHDHIKKNGNHNICDALKLHPDGLSGLFPSGQLSLSKSGFIEPLTPPFRHHKFCWDARGKGIWSTKHLMSMDYLVHDFEFMCRNLKQTSRKVFIDMGASLSFHGGGAPAISLLELYENFGFHFDHIFAFEITYTEPKEVFGKLLPDKYFASYHWINTGVSSGDGDKLNPLQSVLQKFSEDDLIIVKLDIDTASIELPLVKQLLEGGPGGIYHQIVDQFYFEHHVHLGEIAKWWSATGDGMEGTIKESLEMFHGLRKNGIPAHYWP